MWTWTSTYCGCLVKKSVHAKICLHAYDTYLYTAVNEEWGEGDSSEDVSNLPVIKKNTTFIFRQLLAFMSLKEGETFFFNCIKFNFGGFSSS